MEKGSVVAVTGGVPVYAQMTGIVRGMLQSGVQVSKNLKIGDIDARAESSHCYTISDKARAIGGGVLEAVTGFERMKDEFAIVILAAGAGTRFGGNKLNALVRNKPLYDIHWREQRHSVHFRHILSPDQRRSPGKQNGQASRRCGTKSRNGG